MSSTMAVPVLDRDAEVNPGETGVRAGLVVKGLLTAVFLCAVAWGGLRIADPATLPIRQVVVRGDFIHLSPTALKSTAQDVVRGGFFNVNVETIRATLMRDPWVRSVVVKRVWPDALHLYVREQSAVARWSDTGLINEAGTVFSPPVTTFPAGLPVLSGPAGSERLLLNRYRDLEAGLGNTDWRVGLLQLNERRAWSFRLEGGPVVIIGRTNVAERLQRFNDTVVTHFAAQFNDIVSIDLRYTNGFSIRWAGSESTDESAKQGTHGKEN